MALNTWWDGDPGERYWMEVATTGAMGDRLIAPKVPDGKWMHEMVAQVRPGDRVLHWEGVSRQRGLVGWSTATAEPEVVSDYTSPRPGAATTEGWMVPLSGLNRFEKPVFLDELQERRQAVLDVAARVEAAHRKPIYFPFYLYGGTTLRTQQGYLTKFPAELLDVFPSLDAVRTGASDEPDGEVSEETRKPRQRVPKGKITRIQDPVLRSAIENYAVDLAIQYYTKAGGHDFEKLGKPYDIKLTLDGAERHVEVKGSSLTISTVELTINEVTHAGTCQPTDLIVVDGIDYERSAEGAISTSGGRLRAWSDWTPLEEDLDARKFAYSLPETLK